MEFQTDNDTKVAAAYELDLARYGVRGINGY